MEPTLFISGAGIEDGDISSLLTADIEVLREVLKPLMTDDTSEAEGALKIVRHIATLLTCGTVPYGMDSEAAIQRGVDLLAMIPLPG